MLKNKDLIINKVKKNLNGKNFIIIFILLLSISFVSAITYKPYTNFWYNLYTSFNNNIINSLFFILLIINTLVFKKDNFNYFYNNRFGEYKRKIRFDIYEIIFMSSIIFFTFLILNISFSVIFSLNNFDNIKIIYDSPIYVYIIFVIIRYFLYCNIIAVISYIFSLIYNNYIKISLLLILIGTMIIPLNQIGIVDSIFNSSIIFINYLSDMKFTSFYIEFLCSLVNILIYTIILSCFYLYLIKRKVDVL